MMLRSNRPAFGPERVPWWMRCPRQNLTLASLLLSLAVWGLVLPAICVI
jgi:hypothetical protein